MTYKKVDQYLQDNMDGSIAELFEFVRIPSVAAQNRGIQECADFVINLLEKRGFTTELIDTGGAPLVYAERKGKSDKTLLFYNHYDVQPEDPIDLWDSEPFEPEERDGKIYGRGISDDKGALMTRIYGLDAILDEDGELPCNVKFIIEGEEEIGSVNLPPVIEANVEKFAGDACVWEFGGVDHRGVPMQYLGLRGICYIELSVTTASQDSHSGLAGTIFPNAAWRLTWALASLKDPDEKIRIPNYYENVVPPSERDWELFRALPDPTDEYKSRYGIKEFIKGNPSGAELMVQSAMEPSLTICGLDSGYQGSGSKTVMPAKAMAKVDFRLVPNQTPEEVLEKLRKHLDTEGFEDIEITYLGGEAPGRTDPDDPFVELVVNAATEVYEVPQDIVPMVGGSGPNHAFIHYLKVPVVSLGPGYPGTQIHAPNENIRLADYLKASRHVARVVREFGNS